jgi:hypothetical protein
VLSDDLRASYCLLVPKGSSALSSFASAFVQHLVRHCNIIHNSSRHLIIISAEIFTRTKHGRGTTSSRRTLPGNRRLCPIVGTAVGGSQVKNAKDVLTSGLHSLLVTFSTPYIHSIYFLSQSSIRYGTFGWCDTSAGNCLTQFGYRWDPQVIQWLVKAQQVLVPLGKWTGTHPQPSYR